MDLKILSSSSFKLLKAVFMWVDLQALLFELSWKKKKRNERRLFLIFKSGFSHRHERK